MSKRKFLIFMSLILTLVVLSWGVDRGWAQNNGNGNGNTKDKIFIDHGKVPPSEQKAAAKRAAALGLIPGVAGTAAAIPAPGALDGPGGVPHYFGPYGNWAYSPLPKGPVAVVTLADGGTGYNNPLVFIDDVYGTGSSATVAATFVTGGAITGFTSLVGGVDYSAPVVTIVDNPALCGGLAQPECGTGATATATIGGTLTGGIRKFVDKVPGLTPAGANNVIQAHGAGQYIPLAVKDTISYSGSDYYEIALVEYAEKMHSDLQPTRQRGAMCSLTRRLSPVLESH